MNRAAVEDRVDGHEGYRAEPYRDHLGNWTVGTGHLVHEISLDSVRCRTVGELLDYLSDPANHERWFDEDIDSAILIARAFAGAMFDRLTGPRQEVLVEMAFQLGNRLHAFRDLKAAVETPGAEDDVAAMLDSLWATVQTPKRAHRLAAIYRSG